MPESRQEERAPGADGIARAQAVTQTVEAPEVAFTGDTSAQFITHPGNGDALRARLLIMVRRPPRRCLPGCQCAARRGAGCSLRAPEGL
jgi:hypothetical protein